MSHLKKAFLRNISASVERGTALLTIFLLPTQLGLHFWPSYAFIFGIRVDYFSPTIYLTDLLIMALVGSFFIGNRGGLNALDKYKKYLFLFGLFAVFNIAFSTSWQISLYRWVKIFEAALFFGYVYLRGNFIGPRRILRTLIFSGGFFSLIGISQFFLGRTTGLFYILGERVFRVTTPGIALSKIGGINFLRAYSTLPHPNALAGYLGLTGILFFSQKFKTPFYYFVTFPILLCFLLTFSVSAFLATVLLCVATLLIRKSVKVGRWVRIIYMTALFVSIVFPLVSPIFLKNFSFRQDISERLRLSYVSGYEIGESFLAGKGMGTFILNSVRYNVLNNHVWLLQPVHNIFLLIFSEAGIFGILTFSFLVFKLVDFLAKRRNYLGLAGLVFIIVTGLFDHYWLTIQQNVLMASLFFGLSLRFKKIKW